LRVVKGQSRRRRELGRSSLSSRERSTVSE
jgi:hypothetical protein